VNGPGKRAESIRGLEAKPQRGPGVERTMVRGSGAALFLPRDAMRKRGFCSRPSVRLSLTLVYCIQMAEDIVKLLFQSGSLIILVF